MRAVLAALNVSAERGGATGLDRRHDLQLAEADMAGVGLATPPHGREVRRPPGEAAPRGRSQAGGDRLARLTPSRSSRLFQASRMVLTATRE